MVYKIQHRIHTLSHNAVMNEVKPASFTKLGIDFAHWKFSWVDGWSHFYWLAEANKEARNLHEAADDFRKKLGQIVPRIALIGQCYSQYAAEPFLIHKIGSYAAYLRYVTDRNAVPLMFREEEVRALDTLLNSPEIPEEFYLYWNDAVNTIGYSAKLVMMFAALEALFKSDLKKSKTAYYSKIGRVFGPELKVDLYGTKENPRTGLRHRLTHGEYLGDPDTEKNYVELIHKHLIGYFNVNILGANLISENVVSPQRHLFGNIEGWSGFIRPKSGGSLNLKEVLDDFTKHDSIMAEKFEYLSLADHPLLSEY